MKILKSQIGLVVFRTGVVELSDPNKSEIRFWKFAVSEIWDHLRQLSSLGSVVKSQKHSLLEQLKPETEPQPQLPGNFGGL